MTENQLNGLFEKARNQSSETKLDEVTGWVTAATVGAGAIGVLSMLKLNLLTKKGIMYIITTIIGLGIGVTVLVGMNSDTTGKTIDTQYLSSDEPDHSMETAILYDSTTQESMEDSTSLLISVPIIPEPQTPEAPIKPIGMKMALPPFPVEPITDQFPISPIFPATPKPAIVSVNSEKRIVGNFTKISVSSVFEVILSQGNKQSVRVEADQKFMDKISTKTIDGELRVKIIKDLKLNGSQTIKVHITVTDLEQIEVSGAVNLFTVGQIESNKVKLIISGAVDADLNLISTDFTLDCSGAATVNLKGGASTFKLEASGASSINAYLFKTETIQIDCSGASNVNCTASTELNGEVSGASSLYYKGNPGFVGVEKSGVSTVKRK